MRKLLISAALLSAAAIAAPASAQYQDYGRGYGYGYNNRGGQHIQRQLDQIVDRIRRAGDRGSISRREENRLLRFADQIDRLHDRYRRNGLTQWEHRDLQNRIQNLRQRFRFARQDDRRWDRDDDDRWDRDYDRDDDD